MGRLMTNVYTDSTVVPFDSDDFTDRRTKQEKLSAEMVRKFGRNRFTISIEDHCIVADHMSERELINR